MGCSSDARKCYTATKKQLKFFHLLSRKDVHECCSKEKKNIRQINGKRLNIYIDILKETQIADALDYRFADKPYKICANMEQTINKVLVAYNAEQIRKEEQHFANLQQYNLRSNGNHILEEEIWVDNCFNAIEEEEEEQASDPDQSTGSNLLAGGNNNNSNNNNNRPPTASHQNLPRTSKLKELLQVV